MIDQSSVTDDKGIAHKAPDESELKTVDKSKPVKKFVRGKEDPLKHPKRLLVGGGLILVGFIFSILLVYWLQSLFSLGISGIAIFFVVLIGADIFSGTTRLNTGEIRKAITVSFISVYLLWFGILDSSTMNNPFMTSIIDNYWKLIAIIIGFYFGGRSAEEVAKKVTGSEDKKPAEGSNQNPEEIITKIRQILKI
ncbi:MAG: hypothetical protein ACXVHV_11880 [Methanobacterium sp.]